MNKDLTLADLSQFIRKNIAVSIVTAFIFSIITYLVSSSMAVTTYTYSFSYEVVVAWDNVDLSPSGAMTAADFAESQVAALKPRMKGTDFLKNVIKDAGYEGKLSVKALSTMISLSSEEDVPIINVDFSGTNPKLLKRLAHTYVALAPKHIKKVYVSLDPFEPVRYKNAYTTPVKTYTTSSFVLALLGILVLLYFVESLDTRVKSATEIEKKYEIANLGIIPNFYISKKNSYTKYGYQKGASSNYES